MNSKVSIVIPSYNHVNFIEAAIKSVVEQTYKNIELIVIDDGSTDGSIALLEQLQKKYNFIFVAQSNKGIAETMNRALFEYSTGGYFGYIGSDDLMVKDKVSKQVEFLKANLNFEICHTDMLAIDSEMNPMGDWSARFSTGDNLFLDFYSDEIAINSPTVLFRSEVFKAEGGYDERFTIEDFPTWLKLSQKYEFGYLQEPLTLYRRHGDNWSANRAKMVNEIDGILSEFSYVDKGCSAILRERHLKWFLEFSKTDKAQARIHLNKCKALWFRLKFMKAWINLYFREPRY